MKVKLDDEVVFEFDEKSIVKLLGNDLVDPLGDIKRRLRWVVEHKCERCFDRLKNEWLDKLMSDPSVDSIPADKQKFIEMVMSRPDYKNRQQRDLESLSDLIK